MTELPFLLNGNFRSNPQYELIEWNRLSQSEQQALAGLSKDEEVFGLFRPIHADARLNYKVAYKEVALLYYTLQQQQMLPSYTRLQKQDEMNRNIARLVLEGILEVECQQGFVSGAAAHTEIYKMQEPGKDQASAAISGLSFLANLSLNALQYVVHLDKADIRGIASRLYTFNTIPVFAGKMTAVRSAEAIEQFLGFAKGAPYEWQLQQHWEKNTTSSGSKWLSWSRRGDSGSYSKNDSIYKLYISPQWESLPKVFTYSLKILSASKAFSFKIGNDPHGLLRPDKMVAYFHQHEDLLAMAGILQPGLQDIPPHGVPFTAQLDEKGILSWGVDPPGCDVLENFEGGSWRARVTEKLAAAIIQAKATGLQRQDSLQYALHKISLEGIDTSTWTPGQHIWQ